MASCVDTLYTTSPNVDNLVSILFDLISNAVLTRSLSIGSEIILSSTRPLERATSGKPKREQLLRIHLFILAIV